METLGRTPPSITTSFLSPQPPSDSHILSFNDDSEADSDCPQTVAHRKGLKFNVSDITRLRYNSNVAQFNNWLADLKSAFDGDSAKFPTNRHKIILASMTMDEQLKTSYNSIVLAHPTISSHWRKFKRWIQSVVLHGDSDKLKLSTEFTMARQRPNEDPNQFYLRLFNLGIQTSRTVDIEDFRTRLVKPLQNLLLQHDRTYPNTQDIVVHAARLWQTMDPEKIKQEIKEDRERRQQRRQVEQGHQSFKPGRGSNQSHRRQTTHLSGRRPQKISRIVSIIETMKGCLQRSNSIERITIFAIVVDIQVMQEKNVRIDSTRIESISKLSTRIEIDRSSNKAKNDLLQKATLYKSLRMI